MNGIKERADRIAGWILRREGMLKAARLPKVLADMLAEQRTADIDKTWEVALAMYNMGKERLEPLTKEEYIKAVESIPDSSASKEE